jgi:hypothetical protein
MVAGLALVLSLAAPQSASPQAAPAPPSAGEMSAPNPRAEKLQLQIDALRQQNAEKLQLQIDTLREHRPSLIPPLIVFGVGVSCIVIAGVLASKNDFADGLTGIGLGILGAGVTLVGLVWLIVEAAILSSIDREIEVLEAQQRNGSSGVHVTPWARDGAGGLALSLPLP